LQVSPLVMILLLLMLKLRLILSSLKEKQIRQKYFWPLCITRQTVRLSEGGGDIISPMVPNLSNCPKQKSPKIIHNKTVSSLLNSLVLPKNHNQPEFNRRYQFLDQNDKKKPYVKKLFVKRKKYNVHQD
jgi:hypothetical protein